MIVLENVNSEIGATIDNLFNESLDELGIYRDKVHLINYNKESKLRRIFENKLRQNDIDLSFNNLITPLGVKVGGNVNGIASDYIYYVIKNGWNKKYDGDLEFFDNINNYYIEDRFGYCDLTTKSKFFQLAHIPNSTNHIGYGSQASTYEYETNVYKDDFNNIKVSRHVYVYD